MTAKNMEGEKNWELKLRYGKLQTPYIHLTVLAPVIIPVYNEVFNTDVGKAWLSAKVWAEDIDAAAEIVSNMAKDTGLEITGNIEIYDTDPQQAPRESPYVYSINFSYYTD